MCENKPEMKLCQKCKHEIKCGIPLMHNCSDFEKKDKKVLIVIEDYNTDIKKAIHYPDCWDTMAYPTLASALWEMIHIHLDKCPTCKKSQGMGSLSGEKKK